MTPTMTPTMNRKKHFMSIVMVLFATFCFAQSDAQKIKFELYLVDSCENTISKVKSYTLTKNGKNFSTENEDGIVFLKEKGTYERSTIYNEELKKSINRQSAILTEGGIICHSFWKGEGSEVFKKMFVNYHDKIDLISCFSGFFDCLLMLDYQEFEEADSILFIGRKR